MTTVVVAAICVAPYALADTLTAVARAGLTYDSNVFRTRDARQSDLIANASVGLRLEKPYSQQVLQGELTKSAARYDKLSHLDHDGLAYRAAWLWHLSPRLRGTISADQAESLASFADTTSSQRNVRTNDNRAFTLDWTMFGGWHVTFGLSKSRQTSEVRLQAQPDFRSITGEGGLLYEFSSGSSLTATHRSTQGDYLDSAVDPNNPGTDSYRDKESALSTRWIVNQHSTATGRLAWVERDHDTAIQQDFSGPAGELGYQWTPTAKLRLGLTVARRLSVYQTAYSTHVASKVMSFAPSWQASEKFTLNMLLERIISDYRAGPATTASNSRQDRMATALVGANWQPVSSAVLGTSLQYQQRSSDDALSNYDATIGSINVSIEF